MTIAFIHPGKSFLPEIEAYKKFFAAKEIDAIEIDGENREEINADIEWHFMGTDNKRSTSKSVIIHEYASASTAPFSKAKNLIKQVYNRKPDFRLFLNSYVKGEFNFKDNIPFGFRDMGIDELFFNNNNSVSKEFDFLYTGSVEPEREIEKLLTRFSENDLTQKSLLILSKEFSKLANQFSSFSNIRFAGPVPHEEVAAYIRRSRFCINYIPDKEPFNKQTPVKLLEYLALRTPVISSRYDWMEQFQQQYGGNYFFLEKNLSNLNWENVSAHPYTFPDMHSWSWDTQIRSSGVLEFLKSKFRDLQF